MSALAKAIIAAVKNNHSILNWDGETSKQDLLDNIGNYVCEFGGWDAYHVTFKDDVLAIHVRSAIDKRVVPVNYDGVIILEEKDFTQQEHILSYNVRYGREIYGRLSHAGLYYPHLAELNQLLKLH
jgi:hypothetical protein